MASMQRLQPLQNHHFGSKNKIVKNISKTSLQAHHSYSMKKKLLEKTPNIPEMRPF